MRLHSLYPVVAFAAIGTAHAQGLDRTPQRAEAPVQATCSQSSGERKLSRVTPQVIEVRSGSTTRPVDLAQIQSIDMTGPVNRNNRYAWATVKTSGGEERNVALVLPSNDHTLLLEGVGAQGKPDTIDVLTCNRIVFKAGT